MTGEEALNMFSEYTVEEIQEARDVLKEMRHNCIPHESDLYDDPKRDIKIKALDIALKYIPS